jgi:hypothetical protein
MDLMNVLPGDFAGAHATARIPVSGALLNRLVADALARTTSPVRSVDIRPRAGDRFDAVVAVSWPFVPALTVTLAIEQQPTFPDSPILILRWSLLGAVGVLASRFLSSFAGLPDGIRIEGDRLLLNLPLLVVQSPLAPMLGYVTALELHTLDGRAVVNVELTVPE